MLVTADILPKEALSGNQNQRAPVGFVTFFRVGVRCAVGRSALQRFAAFLCSLAITLGFPHSQPEAENGERRHGRDPALGRSVTMAT